MALVTLSGVISAADLNTNFGDAQPQLNTNALSGAKDWQVDVDVLGLTSTARVKDRVDFTAPDDLELRALGLATYGNAVDTPTVTLTVTCIAGDTTQTSLPDQLVRQTVTTSLTANIAAAVEVTSRVNYNASATATITPIYLERGLTYRMALTSSTATALARTFGFVLLRSRRRRA